MSDDSGIEWTDATWNPLVGCSRVSAGCEHCYAERFMHRGLHHKGLTRSTSRGPVWTGEVRLVEKALDLPLRWRKPRRVFVNSLSDLFHEGVSNETIAAIFGVMAASMQHTYQVLTKRPERMRAWFAWIDEHGGLGPYIRSEEGRSKLRGIVRNQFTERTELYRGEVVRSAQDGWAMVMNAAACIGGAPLPNVWLGVSCENQEAADERIPLLLQTPAAVRFVSAEPLLGPIDFGGGLRDTWYYDDVMRGQGSLRRLDWIIAGGESGPGARPCDVAWIRSIVEQCRDASVLVFVKQLGGNPKLTRYTGMGRDRLRDRKGGDPGEWPEDLRVRQMPTTSNSNTR